MQPWPNEVRVGWPYHCPGREWERIRKHSATVGWLYHCPGREFGNVSGNIRPQSSELAEPLWTEPDVKSGIGVRELISTSNFKESAGEGMNGRVFFQILANEERVTITTTGSLSGFTKAGLKSSQYVETFTEFINLASLFPFYGRSCQLYFHKIKEYKP